MRHLSNKEKKELNALLPKEYELDKKEEIIEKENILYKDQEKYLIILERDKKQIKKLIPHLKNLKENCFKSVYIDHGAIPFLMKGADMMRPGIHKIDKNIQSEEIILVRDLEYNKVLAIGQALHDSEKMETQEKGISVKILHFIKDDKF